MTTLPRVTTRQDAFLRAHGIPLDVVDGIGVQDDGVHVAGRINHPWTEHATITARAGDFLRQVLPYPDPATREAAIAARNGDWEEHVGPETAAMWRALGRRRDTPAREGA